MRASSASRIGRAAAVAAALTAGILLTGCGPVDAGTAGRQTTEREFRDDPAVESMDLGSSNTLPWSGSVDGTITAKAHLSDDELGALVDRVGTFTSKKHEGASMSLKVEADTVTLQVLPDRAWNARLVASANELRADASVREAELDADPGRSAKLTARTATAARAFELAATGSAPLRKSSSEPAVEIEISSEDGVSLAGAQEGTWVADAQRVWATVGLGARVSGLSATPEELRLQVADDADLARAKTAAESVLGDREISLSVESRFLQLGDGASGDAARGVLDRLPAESRTAIDYAWTDDRVMQLHLKPGSVLEPVATALAAVPGSSEFRTLALLVDGPGQPAGESRESVTLFAPPADLAARAAGIDRLLASGTVSGADVTRTGIDVVLAAGAGDTERSALAPTVKGFARLGDWVCVKGGTGIGTACVTALDRIPATQIEESYRAEAKSFVDRWNAAPPMAPNPSAE